MCESFNVHSLGQIKYLYSSRASPWPYFVTR